MFSNGVRCLLGFKEEKFDFAQLLIAMNPYKCSKSLIIDQLCDILQSQIRHSKKQSPKTWILYG